MFWVDDVVAADSPENLAVGGVDCFGPDLTDAQIDQVSGNEYGGFD